MADAKIITYGEPFSATTDVVPDNQTVALDIESLDGKEYVRLDTTDGTERLILGNGDGGSGVVPTIIGNYSSNRGAYPFIIDNGTQWIEMITGGTNKIKSQTATNFQLGTHGSHTLELITANTARVHVDASGKISTGGEDTSMSDHAGSVHIYTGDSQVTDISGSSDQLIIEGGDANTGLSIACRNTRQAEISFVANGTNNDRGAIRYQHHGHTDGEFMMFRVNDATRATIDSAGRIAVGITDASGYWASADDLVINRGADTNAGITIAAVPSSGTPVGTLSFANGTSGNGLYQNVIQGTGSGSTDGIRLITNATSTECLRLTTDGDILCPQLDASSDVQTDGSKNLTTSSDMRLKNPIAELEAGLDKVNQLVPRFFSWKSDEENKSQLGFFSQEVHEVCPEAAPKSPKMVILDDGVGSDGTNACDKEAVQAFDADGNPDFNWSLNSRAIVALLVKSVQELSAKVTALESAQGN